MSSNYKCERLFNADPRINDWFWRYSRIDDETKEELPMIFKVGNMPKNIIGLLNICHGIRYVDVYPPLTDGDNKIILTRMDGSYVYYVALISYTITADKEGEII